MKVRQTKTRLIFKCPACGDHAVPASRWTLTGTPDAPTIRPSLISTVNPAGEHHHPGIPTTVCHSLVTDGKIRFMDDCTHALKGQTFDLAEFLPEELA